jgi:hypothetical protein
MSSIIGALVILAVSVFLWFIWSADAVQAVSSLFPPPKPSNMPTYVLVVGGLAAAIIVLSAFWS